jgi:hypothetical protein
MSETSLGNEVMVKFYEDMIEQTTSCGFVWRSGSFSGEYCTDIENQHIRVSFNIGFGRSLKIGALCIFPNKITFPLHDRLEEVVLQQIEKREQASIQQAESFLSGYVRTLTEKGIQQS